MTPMKTCEHFYVSSTYGFKCTVLDPSDAVPEGNTAAVDIACYTAARIRKAFGMSAGHAAITVPVEISPGKDPRLARLEFAYDLLFRPMSSNPAIAMAQEEEFASAPSRDWIRILSWNGPDRYRDIVWDESECSFSYRIPGSMDAQNESEESK